MPKPKKNKKRKWLRRVGILAVILLCILVAGKFGLEAYLQNTHPLENLPTWITTTPIAHRGLHDSAKGIPENSLAAFEQAIKKGYPIELDVQLLADGEIVVFHDKNLKRMTGDTRDITTCTAEDIKPLRLANTKQTIPLLKDVLALVNGRVGLLVEIKNESRKDRTLERILGPILTEYSGSIAIQSFNPYSLKWFRDHYPDIPRGQLAGDFRSKQSLETYKKICLENLLLISKSQPAFIAYDFRCLPAWAVEQTKKGGLPVIAWTISSDNDKKQANPHCDNIIFENIRP